DEAVAQLPAHPTRRRQRPSLQDALGVVGVGQLRNQLLHESAEISVGTQAASCAENAASATQPLDERQQLGPDLGLGFRCRRCGAGGSCRRIRDGSLVGDAAGFQRLFLSALFRLVLLLALPAPVSARAARTMLLLRHFLLSPDDTGIT